MANKFTITCANTTPQVLDGEGGNGGTDGIDGIDGQDGQDGGNGGGGGFILGLSDEVSSAINVCDEEE